MATHPEITPNIYPPTSSTRPVGKILCHCAECGTEYWMPGAHAGVTAFCFVCWDWTEHRSGRHPEVADRIGEWAPGDHDG